MAEDFFNGLSIVPLAPGDHWLRRLACMKLILGRKNEIRLKLSIHS